MNPEKTCQLIGACAVLNNIALLQNEPIDGLLHNEDQPDIGPYHGPENGKAVRDYICNTFFFFNILLSHQTDFSLYFKKNKKNK